MFKKLISALTLTAIFAAYTLTPAFADGLDETGGTTSDTAAVTEDVVEMADRIVETEGEILVMSDRIVETEEIVAAVSPNDDFDDAALDASAETREVMEYGALPNELGAVKNLVLDADVPVAGDTIVGLSDDIGTMADRILETEEEIGTMADRIVETEYLLAETSQTIDGTPDLSLEDAQNMAEVFSTAADMTVETAPSTSTVTEAVPSDSLEVLSNDLTVNGAQTSILTLSDDIGIMADNILKTEGDIGSTANRIVIVERSMAKTFSGFWR
jgi:hypothetical protein